MRYSFLHFTLLLFFFLNTTLGRAQLLDSLQLDSMPAYTSLEQAMREPDKVIKLVLRKNRLRGFPMEVLNFKNLQYLDISKNIIKELPDSIGKLKNLQYLICSKTELEHIPKQIGQLVHLKYINFNQNELVALPPQMGNLSELTILDLSSNNLEMFPETLRNLQQLKVLDLRNILLSDEQQAELQAMMPKTLIHFSPSCKCKW